MAGSGQRPGLLLNILPKGIRQATLNSYPAPKVNSTRQRNPGTSLSLTFCTHRMGITPESSLGLFEGQKL